MNVLNHSAIATLCTTDILVIGGGSAGCCAALAARESAIHRVMLVERYGFLGGTSTQMLDTFYGFFTPGNSPKKVVGGIPNRVIDFLDEREGVFLRPNTYGAGTGVNYNPELLKLVWDNLLDQAGVKVLLHSYLIDVEMNESKGIHAAIFWNKSGFFKVAAKRFIDATGDADFCHHAGFAYEKAGESEPAQTLTTTFRMSNVDLEKFERSGGKKVFMERMSDAFDNKTHPLPRKAGSSHAMCQKKCISTVAVRVSGVDATDMEALTRAEQEGRRQAFIYEQFFRDEIPGYEDSNIIGLSHQIGVRETRRVYGEYRLTREDCLSIARFDDCILLCGAPIEDHREAKGNEPETVWAYPKDNAAYDVPYRSIIPQSSDQVWVVGRCFSATHDAHASCRSMGQTMAMGQAGGLAAALSLEEDASARSITISVLQDRILEVGGVLEMPEKTADTSREGWRKQE